MNLCINNLRSFKVSEGKKINTQVKKQRTGLVT
jgi:hypothetical protein